MGRGAAQGVPPCSLIVSDAGGGAFVVVDSIGNALFSTLRLLASSFNTFNQSSAVYDIAAGSWSTAAPLQYQAPATRLHDRSILLAGGAIVGSSQPSVNASIFSPASLATTATGNMETGHELHTLVTIFNGSALALSGVTHYSGPPGPEQGGALYTPVIELYSPSSGAWAPGPVNFPVPQLPGGGFMVVARAEHVSIVLSDGTVLTSGGFAAFANGGGGGATGSAEIFDPRTAISTAVGSMSNARVGHQMILLNDGTALSCGGVAGTLRAPPYMLNYVFTCDLFIPSSGLWEPTGSLTVRSVPASANNNVAFNPWFDFTLSLLPNGQILASGPPLGLNPALCEQQFNIYDPQARTWSVPASVPAFFGSPVLLPTGQLLLPNAFTSVAECQSSSAIPAATVLYDPLTGKQTVSGSVPVILASPVTSVLF